MKATFIKNGKLQLILTPSDEVEKILLTQLSQTPVEMQQFSTLQVGTDSVNDAVVLTPAIKGEEKLYTVADMRKAFYEVGMPESEDVGDTQFLSFIKKHL